MDSPLRTIVATTLIGAICAVLLVGVRGVVVASINRNLSIDEQRAILDALYVQDENGDPAASASAEKVEGLYNQYVEKIHGKPGIEQEFDVFRYIRDGAVKGTAIRVFGKGLWGEMRGFLALDPRETGADKWIVRGLVIYMDDETPGLGKRVRDKDFKERFRAAARKLVPGLQVLKGEGQAEGSLEVDGLTSATITGQGIQGMIDRAIDWYARSDYILNGSRGVQ